MHKLLQSLQGTINRLPVLTTGAIGLEVGLDCLHMLQLQAKGAEVTIRAGVSLNYGMSRDELLATPKAFSSLVKKGLKDYPFKGRKVVSCLPGGWIRKLNLNCQRKIAGNDAEAVIEAVMGMVDGKLDELVVDYLPIRGEETELRNFSVLAAVAKKADVYRYLNLLTAAGLDPVALDIGPEALRRLVTVLDQEKVYPTVLLINFGRTNSYLTVIAGSRLLLDLKLHFGAEMLINKLQKALHMSAEEASDLLLKYGLSNAYCSMENKEAALKTQEIIGSITGILKADFLEFAEEVNKAVVYTASEIRGQSISQVYLLGSLARYPGVEAYFDSLLAMTVKVVNPLDYFACTERDPANINHQEPVSIAVATGLALRGLVPHA